MWCHTAIALPYFLPAGTYARLFFFDTAHKYVMIWWHKVLEICYTMADLTPTSSTPKDVKHQSRVLKWIDPDDPNDRAFELMTIFVFYCVATTPLFFLFESSASHPLTSFIN